MKIATLFFLIIFFSASILNNQGSRRYFIVWNVGQGQWTSLVENNLCTHFDLGGEFAPFRKIREHCWKKPNEYIVSHWDADHLSFLSGWRPPAGCLKLRPVGKSSRHKMAVMDKISTCTTDWNKDWKKAAPKNDSALDSNSKSHVVAAEGILLPGDSPAAQEKNWLNKMSPLNQIRILILGHHGSATSTSDELLKQLPGLKMTVASARWKRYHHPHPKTLVKVAARRVPLLRTEDWGNLFFELPPPGAIWPGAF